MNNQARLEEIEVTLPDGSTEIQVIIRKLPDVSSEG